MRYMVKELFKELLKPARTLEIYSGTSGLKTRQKPDKAAE